MTPIVLTKEDCEFILSNLDYSKFQEGGSVAHNINTVDGNGINVRFRKENSATFVVLTEGVVKDFIFEKLQPTLNIKSIPSIKIMRYNVGDGMAKHQDFDKYGASPIYKTISIQLSETDDYEGGDLILENEVQSRERGAIAFFRPTQEHAVETVTKGTRFAVIIFLEEKDFILTKSLI